VTRNDSDVRIGDVLARYRELCAWCDAFYTAVYRRQKARMKCRQGCGMCCILRNASPIEAAVIRDYLAGDGRDVPALARNRSDPKEMCPLLVSDECSIYPARPIICRTHGLPMRYRRTGVMQSCIENFRDIDTDGLDPGLVLDMDKVTQNLMRLNLAYCRIVGLEGTAGERVSLASLI
jgi:hypothetical protein